MLILLYGQDTYRSRQKLNEIIEQYKKIHQSGLNLIWQKENLNFEKIREAIESVSMFNEKKLIILEDIFQNNDFQEKFFEYAKKSKLKENKDQSGQIDKSTAQKLAFYLGNDLWQMNREITKLIHYQPKITSESIDLLVKPKIEPNIFQAIDALGEKNKKTALKLLYQHLEKGDNEIYLLTMLAYQFRNLIKLKSLIEQNTPYYNLAKKAKLHPFVVKKTSAQLKNFSLNELKKIYQKLLEIEVGIKKGLLEPKAALDLLVGEL